MITTTWRNSLPGRKKELTPFKVARAGIQAAIVSRVKWWRAKFPWQARLRSHTRRRGWTYCLFSTNDLPILSDVGECKDGSTPSNRPTVERWNTILYEPLLTVFIDPLQEDLVSGRNKVECKMFNLKHFAFDSFQFCAQFLSAVLISEYVELLSSHLQMKSAVGKITNFEALRNWPGPSLTWATPFPTKTRSTFLKPSLKFAK